MALVKDDIIENAFLQLGENTIIYNSNLEDQLAVASKLFDNMIKTLCLDTNFLFNTKTYQVRISSAEVDGVWYDETYWDDWSLWLEEGVEKNLIGEFGYELPDDFMGSLKMQTQNPSNGYQGQCVDASVEYNSSGYCINEQPTYRIQGNKVYSNSDSLVLTYFYKETVENMPEYFESYLTYSLAYDLSKAYSTYMDKTQLMASERAIARRKIDNREGLAFNKYY